MLPFFAAVLPVIILFCGLTVDVGMLQLKSLQMQRAADATALGAEIEWERNTGNWWNQGMADASLNGYTNGSNGVSVYIWQGASLSDYHGRFDVLQVTITQNVQTLFMGTLNGGVVNLTVRAGALMPPCAYYTNAKNFAGQAGLWIASASVYPACPAYMNKSLVVDGFARLVGYASIVAGPLSASIIPGTVTPQTFFNVAPLADPLAGIASPSFSSCNYTSYTILTGSATLNPGTYCGTAVTKGMTILNSTVTLNPGLYIITGGAHWTNSHINGTGVTIFFTKGNGAQYGQTLFDGQTYVNLSAPTTSSNGALATILFFSDRNWIPTANQDFQWINSYFTGDGIWYLTGSGIYMWACGYMYAPNYFAIVTDNQYVYNSTVNLTSNFSNIPTGNPFRTQSVLVQ